jgi:hypothetical protein
MKRLGKFGQNNYRTNVSYISSREELSTLYHQPDIDFLSWDLITPDVMQVRTRKKKEFNMPSRSANLVIAAFVTSAARIEIDSDMRAAMDRGGQICYQDTDSLIVNFPKGVPHGFNISPFYNDFKSEIDGYEVVAFFCMGSKNYLLILRSLEDGSMTEIVHVRGFSLRSRHAKNVINSECVSRFVHAALEGESLAKYVPEFRLIADRRDRLMRTRYNVKCYRNNYPTKRVIVRNSRFQKVQTLPYGYSVEMLNALVNNV